MTLQEQLLTLAFEKYPRMVDLARATNEKQSTLHNYKNQGHRMPLDRAEKIARALGLELALVVRRPE